MRRLDRMVARVIGTSLAVAFILLVTGGALALAGRGPSPSSVTALSDMPGALMALEPGGFLDLGLLMLLATPVVRVVAVIAGFGRRRSWVFCYISAFVLLLMALSVYLGLRG